jgi:hypothetical protein
MTILFTASREGNIEFYIEIVEYLQNSGYNIITRNLFENFEASSDSSLPALSQDIKTSDLVIADLTESSTSVGLLISQSVNAKKHVIILYGKSSDDLSTLFKESKSRYIHVAYYKNSNYKDVVSETISKIKKKLNYVLYAEVSSKYAEVINSLIEKTGKSKKKIIEEALDLYFSSLK